ncbi:MAG TPA: HEXXH motif domain-containing protein [Pilimelia sp.]|nr:HEXXH motif domain-containing protein [Pilimelia sp.]
MIGVHRISGDTFTGLATGAGGPHAVRALRDAQLSRHLLLLKFIAAEWPVDPAERDRAIGVLAEAQARRPEAVADLLRDPMVGAWTAWTARRIRGSVDSPVPLHADLGHLGAVAAEAAVRTGLDAELTAYVRDGRATVPTRGSAVLPLPDATVVAVRTRGGALRLRAGGMTVDAPAQPGEDASGWHGLRWLTAESAGRRARVAVNDLDPYRDHHHVPAAVRLPAHEWSHWRDTFGAAWELLVRYAPVRAAELAVGLRSVVPLAEIGVGHARSATARDAFGSFGLTAPDSPAAFAVTLVHEFQHSKLSALLNLTPLYDATHPRTHYAPWRLDPRPIGGLLQGVYAFLSVADTWRRLRAAPGIGELAERQFAEIREQVNHALDTLSRSPALTPHGQAFAAGMRATVDDLMSEPLPAGVTARAREGLARNLAAWRQRNAQPA